MAAPELRLNVSLDLGFFRQQLQKLTGIAQSEFAPKLNVRFNRSTLDAELNNLQRAIKRRTYRVEIAGNIDSLPGKIEALRRQLASLDAQKKIEIPISIRNGVTDKEAKKAVAAVHRTIRTSVLKGTGGKIRIPVSIIPSITKDDVKAFKDAVKSKLTGISADVKVNVKGGGAGVGLPPDFMKYMAEQGLLGKTASGMTMQMGKGSNDIKQQLNDAVQSAEKIKSVFDGVAKNIATTGKSIAEIQGKKLGLVNVPLMAGGVERRIERSASAIGGTTSSDALRALYLEINQTIASFAALKGQIKQNTSKLSGFSLIIGIAAFAGVPLAKSIVKLTGSSDNFAKLLDKLGPKLEAAFAKAAANILSTASSRLLGGGRLAGLLPAAYRGIGPSAEPAGLLPPAYRGIGASRNAGTLPAAYRGLPFGFDFKGLPPSFSSKDEAGELGPTIQQMRQQLFSSIRIAEVRVREIFDIVGDFNTRQKAAGQARLDKAVTDFVRGLEDIVRRGILKAGIRQINIEDLGRTERPALPAGRLPLMLPPAGATTSTGRMRVSTGAYLGQPGFMQAPSVPPARSGGGRILGGTYGGPGNFAGRGGGLGGGFNMPKLPGAGLVREVGEEFAFATKQVLLYGQAYKLLGIAQAFPAQVGEAVGALQSFRNTIGEISPSAQEAAASSQFILDIVEKYNTPLQSARDGFVKLYASMQPAGFTGNEIRDLFLGISQTAATFGMSADKVDRVNYAFAQMASKGQVMSEELKGQLGDVLPGAMAIFAEAAGFEGPEAITKFSKALEAGTYKGSAMKTLLTNVGIVMRKEFGPGAEGAARTFQGVMNRMQNSMKLLYESFEPVAVGFLNAVVMPMTGGIKALTDGFNAFFKGQAAQTAGGSAVAEQLNSLKPAFEGILANIKSLIPSFQIFGSVVFNAAKLLASLAGNPIVGFLFNVYTNVLLVNTAFTLLGGKILLGLIANVNAAIVRIIAFDFAIKALGVQTMGAQTALAGTQLQMLLLQRSAAGMVGPLTLSNLAMAALAGKAALVVGGLVLLGKGVYDTNETFRNFVNNIGGVVASDFRDAVDGMAEDANSATNDIEESYKNLLSRLNPIGNFIKQLFKDVFGSTSDSAEQSASQSSSAFADFFNSLSSNATAGFNGLSAVINNWWSNLPAPIRRIFEGTGVSMLVGAAKYAGSATTRASAPNAQATGMFGKYIPGSAQKKIPSPRTGDGGKTPPLPVVGGGGGGTGEGAKGKKGSTRESQIPQLMLRLEKTRELSAIELKIADATLTNNTAQLSSLELTKQLIEFKYEAKELDLQQLTAQEKGIARKEIALRAEQAILASQLQLQVDLKKERDAVQEGFTSILAGYQEEANYQQMYLNLINQGIRPSLAKAQIEVEKRFKDQEKQLETLIEQNKAEIASLEIQINLLKLQKNLSKESKDQLADAEARLKILQKELELRTGIKAGVPDAKGEAKKEAEKALAPKTTAGYLGEGLEAAQERLAELTNTGYQVVQAANAIGDAFGNAFKGVIDGSMTVREALAGFFQSIADHFADMVAQMVAEWLKAQVIKGFMNIFGMLIPGGGGGDVLGSNSSAVFGINSADMNQYAPLGFANGGIAPGGFTAFANGGMVTGPTMGLVGEGRYNEAIVPLPNGKSIPVELGGASQGNVNVVVNVDAKGSQVEGNEAQSKQLGRVVSAAVQAEIVKQQRPGGLLSSSRSF